MSNGGPEQAVVEHLRRGDLRSAHQLLVSLIQQYPHDPGLRARAQQVEALIHQRLQAGQPIGPPQQPAAPQGYGTGQYPAQARPPYPGGPQTGQYQPTQPGYPQQQSGYPQQQSGYPQQQSGYPQQQSGYPQQQSGYPQQGYGAPQAQPQQYDAQTLAALQAQVLAEPLRYAHAYMQAGRLSEALQLLRMALAKDPNNTHIRDLALHVARQLQQQGQAPQGYAPPAAPPAQYGTGQYPAQSRPAQPPANQQPPWAAHTPQPQAPQAPAWANQTPAPPQQPWAQQPTPNPAAPSPTAWSSPTPQPIGPGPTRYPQDARTHQTSEMAAFELDQDSALAQAAAQGPRTNVPISDAPMAPPPAPPAARYPQDARASESMEMQIDDLHPAALHNELPPSPMSATPPPVISQDPSPIDRRSAPVADHPSIEPSDMDSLPASMPVESGPKPEPADVVRAARGSMRAAADQQGARDSGAAAMSPRLSSRPPTEEIRDEDIDVEIDGPAEDVPFDFSDEAMPVDMGEDEPFAIDAGPMSVQDDEPFEIDDARELELEPEPVSFAPPPRSEPAAPPPRSEPVRSPAAYSADLGLDDDLAASMATTEIATASDIHAFESYEPQRLEGEPDLIIESPRSAPPPALQSPRSAPPPPVESPRSAPPPVFEHLVSPPSTPAPKTPSFAAAPPSSPPFEAREIPSAAPEFALADSPAFPVSGPVTSQNEAELGALEDLLAQVQARRRSPSNYLHYV